MKHKKIYTVVIDGKRPTLLLNAQIPIITEAGDIIKLEDVWYNVIEHDAFNELLRLETLTK